MNAQVRPWRPLSQRDLDRIRGTAVDTFDAWLARWIARLPAGASEAAYAAASAQPPRVDALGWRIGAGIHLASSESAMHKAALLALDLARAVSAIEVEEVRAVIDALRRNLADDLASSIAGAYAQAAPECLVGRVPESQEQSLVLELRRPGTGIELVLHVDRAWAASLPLPAPPSLTQAPPAARTSALEDTQVALAAVLGHCQLTVMELSQLAIGDVLTCDTHVDGAVDLSLISPSGHSGPVVAWARPGRAAGHWAFLVSDVESQKVGNER
jgi:flagellar motor switch/type III secretory pathway protein FliN